MKKMKNPKIIFKQFLFLTLFSTFSISSCVDQAVQEPNCSQTMGETENQRIGNFAKQFEALNSTLKTLIEDKSLNEEDKSKLEQLVTPLFKATQELLISLQKETDAPETDVTGTDLAEVESSTPAQESVSEAVATIKVADGPDKAETEANQSGKAEDTKAEASSSTQNQRTFTVDDGDGATPRGTKPDLSSSRPKPSATKETPARGATTTRAVASKPSSSTSKIPFNSKNPPSSYSFTLTGALRHLKGNPLTERKKIHYNLNQTILPNFEKLKIALSSKADTQKKLKSISDEFTNFSKHLSEVNASKIKNDHVLFFNTTVTANTRNCSIHINNMELTSDEKKLYNTYLGHCEYLKESINALN